MLIVEITLVGRQRDGLCIPKTLFALELPSATLCNSSRLHTLRDVLLPTKIRSTKVTLASPPIDEFSRHRVLNLGEKVCSIGKGWLWKRRKKECSKMAVNDDFTADVSSCRAPTHFLPLPETEEARRPFHQMLLAGTVTTTTTTHHSLSQWLPSGRADLPCGLDTVRGKSELALPFDGFLYPEQTRANLSYPSPSSVRTKSLNHGHGRILQRCSLTTPTESLSPVIWDVQAQIWTCIAILLHLNTATYFIPLRCSCARLRLGLDLPSLLPSNRNRRSWLRR